MIGNIQSKEGSMLQGFIEFEVVNKKNNYRHTYKNTITNGGKQFLIAKSAGSLLGGMGADTYGKMACTNLINKMGSTNTSSVPGRQSRSDRDLTNVLLNLNEDVLNGLGASTSFVNVYDKDFMVAEKVTGYANGNVSATADGKEGVIDYSKGEYMVDPFTICKRWKYPEGVATGTINAIAMMPATSFKDGLGGEGIKFSKCIDQVNTQYTNFVSMSTGFLIPGVAGYTGNTEILLNFNRDGNSRWKYDFSTGEMKAVAANENFFIPTVNTNYVVSDMAVIDGYLYVVSTYPNNANTGIYIDIYDITNNMAKVSSFTCNYLKTGEYKIKANIIKVGNNIYVTALSSLSATSTGIGKVWKLNIGSNGYATSAATGQADYSTLGVNLPSNVDIRHVGIGMLGDKYVLYHLVYLYNTVDSNRALINNDTLGYKVVGYVFTDLADPLGSIVDMIPGITPNEVVFNANGNIGTLRIGFDYYNSNSYFGNAYDLVDAGQVVMNNSAKTNETALTVDTKKAGCYLTLNGWWTNIMSFVKLSTPITKTDTDILYVSYGYKII